jgi:hypothetical protein
MTRCSVALQLQVAADGNDGVQQGTNPLLARRQVLHPGHHSTRRSASGSSVLMELAG